MLVPGLAFTKYHCKFVNLNCIFTVMGRVRVMFIVMLRGYG